VALGPGQAFLQYGLLGWVGGQFECAAIRSASLVRIA
jgi:hypothetical protein